MGRGGGWALHRIMATWLPLERDALTHLLTLLPYHKNTTTFLPLLPSPLQQTTLLLTPPCKPRQPTGAAQVREAPLRPPQGVRQLRRRGPLRAGALQHAAGACVRFSVGKEERNGGPGTRPCWTTGLSPCARTGDETKNDRSPVFTCRTNDQVLDHACWHLHQYQEVLRAPECTPQQMAAYVRGH